MNGESWTWLGSGLCFPPPLSKSVPADGSTWCQDVGTKKRPLEPGVTFRVFFLCGEMLKMPEKWGEVII